MGWAASLAAQVSQVDVNGGAGVGPAQGDVLLGIGAALVGAPGAQVVVYDGPFDGTTASFEALFNAMIDDRVTVISNTWSYCENQTTRADVESIDMVLEAAAAVGIGVFNASGASLATHLWAVTAALLNDASGGPLGFLNPILYPLAGSPAFRSAARLGTDFAHVGLGSPSIDSIDRLELALTGASAGPPSASPSSVEAAAESGFGSFLGIVLADGAARGAIVFQVFAARQSVCTQGCTLRAIKDAFLRRAHSNLNEGANERLTLRRPGRNRPIVAFDAAALAEAQFSRARLVLTVAGSARRWGPSGHMVSAHPLLEDFVEGDGSRLGTRVGARTRGSGPGVTWRCASDAEVANRRTDCPARWDGGSIAPATDAVLVTDGQAGELSWDVTADVLAGRSAWLIRKADERKVGRIDFYSREGAAAEGDPSLAPTLVLE